MRKSFTRLFSIFLLFLGLSLQMAFAAPGPIDWTKCKPTDDNVNAKPTDFATKFVVAFGSAPKVLATPGTIVIYKGDEYIRTIPTPSSSVVVVGNTIEITHGIASFEEGKSYSVAIAPNTIDLIAGGLPKGEYNFTIGDYTAPVLETTATLFEPDKGATGVMANLNHDPAGFSLTIPFKENVTIPATPGNKAVYIYKEDGTVVDIVLVSSAAVTGLGTANITVKVGTNTIFQENTKYYVSIDAGAFVDNTPVPGGTPNYNAFAGLSTPATWTFTTRDYSAPSITASVSDVTTNSAKLNVSLTEKGKYYYKLQEVVPGGIAPDAAAVKAANDAVAVAAANTVVTTNLTVAGSKSYELYVVAENAENPANTSEVKKLTFSSIDITAPKSIARGLVNNADKKTTGIYMVFNEQVKGGSGTLDLRLSSNESYVKQIPASSISSTKITTDADAAKYGGTKNVDWVTIIDFGMTLPSKTAYYAVFPAGFIKDMSDNAFENNAANIFNIPIDKIDWPITSSDFEVPTVNVSFVDASSLSSDVKVLFDETVRKQVSTLSDWKDVLALEKNNMPVAFTVTSPLLAADGTSIIIDPVAALESNTTYTVRLRANAVKDLNNNAITTEKLYDIKTGDLDALTVEYASSLGVDVFADLLANSTLKIKFNKAVKVNTTGSTWVAADAVNLKALMTFKQGATDKAFSVAYDAATFTATITPTDALVSGGAYSLAFAGTKVKDAVGTQLADVTKNITVKDYVAPVAALDHSGDVQKLDDHSNDILKITFNEDVRLLDGVATIADGTDVSNLITFKDGSSNGANLAFTATYTNKVITITPSTEVAVGKTYYYGIGASVKDAAGNVTAGKYASFTMVAPAIAPSILATTYSINGVAQVPVTEKLVNVTPKTGNIVTVSVTFNAEIKELLPYKNVTLTDGVGTWDVAITPANVSYNTLTVDFNVGGPLASEGACKITLPAGLVQGSTALPNNPTPPFAQFGGKVIDFNAKDRIAPIVTVTTPAATNVALNTALKLGINEKVVLGTGNILIKKGGNVVQTIAVNSSNVTLNAAGTEATVVKADLLDYNTDYKIVVPQGAFKDDVSSNGNDAYEFDFKTVVNPQPSVIANGLIPADGSDQVALSPLSLGMTFSENIKKYNPQVGTRKLWYLVKEVGATRASFDPVTFDLIPGTDEVVANNYIETSTVGISGNVVSISTGYTPVANARYYVLITPGSFLDESTGVTVGGNPVPGVYAGIIDATTWNFTTRDENAGVVTFAVTKRSDNKVSTDSNIAIRFSRPIKKSDGSAINDVDIANLFVFTKTAGPGTLNAKAFIGTINPEKTVVTIPNSSLVTLGEMTELSDYNVKMKAGLVQIIYQNGAAVSDCDTTFTTSDYTAPQVVADIANAVADVKKDEATVRFTATDGQKLASLYYIIQPGNNTTPVPTADVVKTGTKKAIAGVSPQVVTNKFTGLAEKTSYVVWTVAVDEAGNTSSVEKVVFTTDDATKPLLVAKPTSFDGAKKLTFTFNEAVAPVAGSVRIFDAASMVQLAVLNLEADANNNKKLITTAFTSLVSTDNIVNYYVEIDNNKVGDVPAQVGNPAANANTPNYFEGLFRTDLMVSSKDATAPAAPALSFIKSATDPSKYSVKLVYNEPVKINANLPLNAAVITFGGNPFEAIDASNIITDGSATVIINISRTLASVATYDFTLAANTFTDMAGNNAPGATGQFTTTDFVAPVATFVPAKNATNVAANGADLTITFNEAIRLLDNSPIDSYDLDSLVYFKKDNVAKAFSATIAGNVITINPAEDLVKDATYTFGFKAKFEDGADNAVMADGATFKTETTTPAAQYLTWTPAKNNIEPWLGTKAPITLTFTSPVFTLRPTAAENNLPVTADYLKNTALVVYKNGVVMPTSDLIFTVVDNKTFTVAPKTNWESSAIIKVEVVGETLQLNEGNQVKLDASKGFPTSSSYKAQDVIAPIVDVTYAVNNFTAGFYPAKVGVDGNSPSIAKTESLKLYFKEDVKVGTGTVEIHRWDGVLAKPAMTVTVDANNKKLVTLGDLTGLPTNQEYYAIVNPGIVVDVTDNNPYAGFTAVKAWKFSLKDDATPQVVAYLPNTDNQPVNSDLTLTFDRGVNLTGAGYVALYKSAAGGDAIQILRVADNAAKFATNGSSVTIDIDPLEVNTKYFVEVSGGTFKSAVAGTDIIVNQGIARADWSFTTEVNTAPTLVAASQLPANNATGVSLDADLEMTFDMPVQAGTGNIQLHAADGSVVLNFDVKGTDVTIVDKVVKVALPKLAESKQYYVIIPGTAILNKTYTPEKYVGITVPYAWKFNTGDFSAPTVTATPNGADADSLALTFDVTLTFSEKVTGVSATTLKVSKGKINTVSTEATGAIYVANITAASNNEVILTVPATIKDVDGNALTETKFTYKVNNFDAPALVGFTPADGSVAIKKDTALVMTFSKTVVPGTGKVNVYTSLNQLFKSYSVTAANISGNKVTIPISGLASFTAYVVTFEANIVKDLFGVSNAAYTDPTKWNFTAGDFTGPVLVSKTPTMDVELKHNHPEFKMTFDENVKFGSAGYLRIYKVGSRTASMEVAITADMFNGGKDVTVTTLNGLDKNTSYYVRVDGAPIVDVFGNKFAGVSDATTYTFKTGNEWLTGIIDPVDASQFKVYPNPFVDFVNVANASELSKIVVTNIAGQVVKEIVNPTDRIQLDELRSGIYFISLYDMDNVIAKTAKIVKR